MIILTALVSTIRRQATIVRVQPRTQPEGAHSLCPVRLTGGKAASLPYEPLGCYTRAIRAPYPSLGPWLADMVVLFSWKPGRSFSAPKPITRITKDPNS